ncbi:hypothetical protein [Arthrobacter bambusae]|uniref:hypothetical protein n=1 Tax=Arthrobacter bambusae TaxID=1338426 RepID=UPI0027D7CB10|nr:hypothetical protein [Arthrobacter bambusae]
METQNLGTVEVPPELRKSFLIVPKVVYWLYAVIALVGLIWGSIYGSVTGDHLIAAGQLRSSGERGYFKLIVAEFIAPAFLFLFASRLLMRRKAKRMADLAADTLGLPADVRSLLQKRFILPWSMSFDRQVSDINLRSRLGCRNSRDRIENIRSKEGWVITVPPDLSSLTVERVPPGYEMKGDYQFSGGSLRKRSKMKKLEDQRYGDAERWR